MRQNGEAYDLPEMWCQTSAGKHDLSEADGCMGYGNVIVFDKAGDVLVGDVLNW